MPNTILRRSFDQGVLSAHAVVLTKLNVRKLSRKLANYLGSTYIGTEKMMEQEKPWFVKGYVTTETPRDPQVGRQLAKLTEGFAVAMSDSGKMLKTGYGKDEFSKAHHDAQRVKISMVALRSMEDDEDDEPDEVATGFLPDDDEEGEFDEDEDAIVNVDEPGVEPVPPTPVPAAKRVVRKRRVVRRRRRTATAAS
jgi:hypothetical protein